jgi:hypothetical protein
VFYDAKDALRAALEQPEPCQYPDCVDNGPEGKCTRWLLAECSKSEDYKPHRPAEPEQEPVAWINPKNLQGLTLGLYGYAEIYTDESQGRVPLFTHPPRREWRSLSEEEIEDLRDDRYFRFARAIEAALRSKNHE